MTCLLVGRFVTFQWIASLLSASGPERRHDEDFNIVKAGFCR